MNFLRIPCYFCESLVNVDSHPHCPFCGGNLSLAIKRHEAGLSEEDKVADKPYSSAPVYIPFSYITPDNQWLSYATTTGCFLNV